jgi:hypothetical protein
MFGLFNIKSPTLYMCQNSLPLLKLNNILLYVYSILSFVIYTPMMDTLDASTFQSDMNNAAMKSNVQVSI